MSSVPLHTRHIVDCNSDPIMPGGWVIDEHRKGGKVTLQRIGDELLVNGHKLKLHLHPNQIRGQCVPRWWLAWWLPRRCILNANIRDYLVAHPELIPDSWKPPKGHMAFINFWGTRFRKLADDKYGFGSLWWFEPNGWAGHMQTQYEINPNQPSAIIVIEPIAERFARWIKRQFSHDKIAA